ncbi:MAG: cytochrome C [Flavobacteriales bacterium]|nr:cytochrome C [Flavobacteriales bacterium]
MKRLFIIGLFLSMVVAVFTTSIFSYQTSKEGANVVEQSNGILLPQEAGVFERFYSSTHYAEMPMSDDSGRNLDDYYANRAYYGAPPYIPHEVVDEISIGADNCLKCHKNGGWVPKFEAYAPVVPHPEKTSCRQCHVTNKSEGVFKVNEFQGARAPQLSITALPGSPPAIPHALFMRENCLSCHAGPSTPSEIRVSHPERVNCRQCHAHNETSVSINNVFARDGYQVDQ